MAVGVGWGGEWGEVGWGGVGGGLWGAVPFSALLATPARELLSDQGPRMRLVTLRLRCHARGCNVYGARTRHGCGTLWLYTHVHMHYTYTCTCSFQHIPSRAASGSHPPPQSTPVGRRVRTGSKLGLRTGPRVELGLGVALGLGLRVGAKAGAAATVKLKLTRFSNVNTPSRPPQ